jgi:hypothetical protein
MKSGACSSLKAVSQPSRCGLGKFTAVATLLCPCLPLAAQEASSPAFTNNVPTASFQSATEAVAANGNSPVCWHCDDWRVYAAFTGQLRFDDNILLTDQNTTSDFIAVAIPSANLEYVPVDLGSQVVVHLDYAPQLVEYCDHSQYDSVNEAANVKLERTFVRSQFKVNYHYDETTEPQAEQLEWGTMQTQTGDVYAGYELTGKTTIDLAPHTQWISVQGGITTWEYGSALEITYAKSEKLALTGSYYAAEVEANPGVNAFKQSVLAKAAWTVTGRSTLDINLGFQSLSFQSSEASSEEIAPQFELDWNYQLTGKTALRLNCGYQTSLSQYLADEVDKVLSGRLILDHQLTEKFSLEARVGTFLLQQDAVLDHAESGGQLEYWNLGLGATYHLNRHAEFRLDYDHQARGDNHLYHRYLRDLVQLSATYKF